jgi:hypothetical protein
VKGMFPENPAATYYGGNAIVTGDASSDPNEAPNWINIHDNQVVGCVPGIAAWAGQNIQVYNNRVVSSALQPNGKYYNMWSMGIALYAPVTNPPMYLTNLAHDNVVGAWDPRLTRAMTCKYRIPRFRSLTPTTTRAYIAGQLRWRMKLMDTRFGFRNCRAPVCLLAWTQISRRCRLHFPNLFNQYIWPIAVDIKAQTSKAKSNHPCTGCRNRK